MQQLVMLSKPKFDRYGGSKVRTGCVTCKQRRVKCDEAKPACNRCVKAGRCCAGYAPPPPKDRNLAGQPLMIISYVAPDLSISLLPGVGSREQRSLEFFRLQTFSETFPTADWPEHLLRTSCHEDAIRHALVALGALHETYQATTPTNEKFAMQQYSKAMKQVMKLDMKGSASTDVALMSCVLFACFENLQGHYRSGLLHVKSGLEILKEQESSNVADQKVAYISKEVLRPIFVRFVTQSREIGDSSLLLTYDTLPKISYNPVSTFQTYHDAHSSLSYYLHEFILFLNSLEPEPERDLSQLQAIVEVRLVLTKRHAAWCKAFDDFLVRGPTATETDIAKLQVWRTAIDITLSLDTSLGERSWDEKTELFQKLLNLCEVVVENQTRGYHRTIALKTTSTQVSGPHLPGMSPRDQLEDATYSGDTTLSEVDYCQTLSAWKPVFSLDLGIIGPLYIICSRCREPPIRRHALQLLASCNRREGIWDSTLTARVAERIIAIEEEGATSHPVVSASQIPEYARIRDLNTKFGYDRDGLISYTKSVDCVGPNDRYEEILEW